MNVVIEVRVELDDIHILQVTTAILGKPTVKVRR